ncbi:MAG: hypothetical protein KC503_43440, partial [Myxococcales bacterium]|nr:hypothetical protein [Myxococcales bacterium]
MLRKLAQAYADLARRARGSDGDARALRRDAMALAPELSQDARIADAQRALRDALGDAARWLAARVYKDGDDDSDFDADTRQSCVTLARYADDLVAAYARSLGDVTCAEALLCIARVASAEAPLSRAASGALGRSFEALLEQGSFEARWLALCGKLVLGTDPTRDDRLLAWLDLLLSARPWPRRPAIARALGHSTSTWSLLLAEGDALLASADEIT